MTEAPHAVAVFDSADEDAATVACGEIGGQLTDTGALVIALEPGTTGGPEGVAVLTPAVENPEATGVSVFLTGLTTAETTDDADPLSVADAD